MKLEIFIIKTVIPYNNRQDSSNIIIKLRVKIKSKMAKTNHLRLNERDNMRKFDDMSSSISKEANTEKLRR